MEVGAGGAVNGHVATCGVGAGGDPRERSVGLGRQEASGGHTFGCVLNIGVLFPNVLVRKMSSIQESQKNSKMTTFIPAI